ncbi:MAG: class I SAM-dependent methyltransferase, partial [Alistipes sp.]|nr:class I SAM-dependent methyltransferase [Alistipes sp.]
VGAGNAQMDFMLANLAPERTIYAIDYDEGKIEVARNSFLGRRTSIEFMCGDMCTIEFPKSDYILFSDSLHYIDSERQKSVLERAIESLNEGGKIIIRDGNASHSHAHNLIELTELWSTKLLKFNKTTTDLCFVSEEWMRRFAVEHNMDIEISKYWRYSSETLYILKTRR